ncbi:MULTISPECIES: TIGR02677 family protein [Saccharothrix]|uniref:TIGR02677 family protein n=1 Tax=Saccharothrix TaxID=2071 RepID=UPI0013017F1B|nr:TIGR02677 family protein [Saccharothrix sp. CB00851]
MISEAPSDTGNGTEADAVLLALPSRMPVVTYLNAEHAPFYRLILDVLLEQEARLGLHLPTAEVEQRVRQKLALLTEPVHVPDVPRLLESLFEWGNVDRIQNTHRKGTYQEYLRKDYLYQLTPTGAQVHQALTAIDAELGATGALQSSMLPEVLSALRELVGMITPKVDEGRGRNSTIPLTGAYASLQRIVNGFTQLSDNAKLFVQGLNRALELNTELTTEVFLAYKDVVVLYLRTFVLALTRYASPIAAEIGRAEAAGIIQLLPRLAAHEAAPSLHVPFQQVVAQDTEMLSRQWSGLRSWFFGEAGRPPVAQTLEDRAAEAVNRIVSTVRRLNEQRFRRLNRAADLLTLADWFAGTADPSARAALWRAAFGMHSVRHLGGVHAAESDLDLRPKASWWETPPVPVEARLRKQGPRAKTGRPSGVGDPSVVKRQLAVREARERAVADAAITTFTSRSPVLMSRLPALDDHELDVLLRCLNAVLSVQMDTERCRTACTPDGRLRITLRSLPADRGGRPRAVVRTSRGDIALEDFELTVIDLRNGDR